MLRLPFHLAGSHIHARKAFAYCGGRAPQPLPIQGAAMCIKLACRAWRNEGITFAYMNLNWWREELRGKYLKLGTGELAAAAVFAFVAVSLVLPSLNHPRDQAALESPTRGPRAGKKRGEQRNG